MSHTELGAQFYRYGDDLCLGQFLTFLGRIRSCSGRHQRSVTSLRLNTDKDDGTRPSSSTPRGPPDTRSAIAGSSMRPNVKVAGRWTYLHHAIDQHGQVSH